jgi:His/Glu/Gln/Arg/opine family amino acid ABC transporter permease subunit
MRATLPSLVTVGLVNTLILSAAATCLALVIGLFLAVMLLSTKRLIRLPARVYVDILRGLPAILTIYLVGFGLPVAGIRPFGRNTFAYAILALGIINGAYICEVFRSGIQSVDRGQMDAARSLGLPHLKAMRLVVVPQGIRRVLPALTNQFIIMIKESSLVYVLGLFLYQRELFSVGQDATVETGNLSPLVAAGIAYLLLTVPLTHFVNFLDVRLREGRPVQTAAGLHPMPAETLTVEI